ncbi:hypothetical protein NBRC116493_33620 [Aurantivibrio infirmus]
MSDRHLARIQSSQTGKWLHSNWLLIASAIVLLLGLGLTSPSATLLPIEEGRLSLEGWDFEEQGPVSLQGQWRSFPGLLEASKIRSLDDYPAKEYSSDQAGIPALSSDRPPIGKRVSHAATSYLLSITGLQTNKNTALSIAPQCGASDIYIISNDLGASTFEPIISAGNTSSNVGAGYISAKIQPMIASIGPLTGQNHSILIHNVNPSEIRSATCNNLEIGTVGQLSELRDQRLVSQGLIIAVIFSIALYAFGMYFQSHSSPSNLWLGLWALAGSVYLWTRASLWEIGFGDWLQLTQSAHYKIEYIALALIGPLGIQFYQYSYDKFYLGRALLKANFIFAGLLCVAIAAFDFNFTSKYLWFIFFYTALQLFGILYVISRAVLDRKANSFLLLLSILPLFVALSIDVIFQQQVLRGNPVSQYAWVFFMFMHCIIQSKRLSILLEESAKKSESLSLEVEKQTEILEEKNRQLLMVQNELRKTNSELKMLSITDGLTGTYNRLYFDHQFQVEWQRSRREKEPFSLILLDIDHFKIINDKYGHLAGDQCLRQMSDWLVDLFKRSNDLVCRYGGEEFAVLLPNTPPDQAMMAAETLRQLVKNTQVKYLDLEISMTISIGVSGMVPDAHHHPIEMISATDKALYKVKNTGRNNVGLASITANLAEA